MFTKIKTFAAAHETAVTVTIGIAAGLLVGVVAAKLDPNKEDYPQD